MDAEETLKEVAIEVTACKNCALHRTRKRSVPGEGPANAEIMLIGEGPGANENEQGRPFVGAAGMFLGTLLQKAGLQRSDVFIANVVKCRPPENRDPLPEELQACGEYLQRQIEAINPRIIVTLGRFSMARYIKDAKISAIHGKPRLMDGKLIVPMFHPAAALHQPALKSSIEQDFARLPEFIRRLKQREQEAKEAIALNASISGPINHQVAETPEKLQPEEPPTKPPEPKQLSLF